MSEPRLVLGAETTCADAAERIRVAAVPGAPVVDGAGRFVGTVARTDLDGLPADEAAGPLARRVDASAPTVGIAGDLDQALDAMSDRVRWVSVLDEGRRVRGIVAVRDLVHGYRTEVQAEERRVSNVGSHVDVLEARVGAGAPVLGRPLGQGVLPGGCLVLAVQRGDAVLPGTASVVLRVGDVVTVLGRPDLLEIARWAVVGNDPGNRPAS
ncbi:CBS domain-containing protein [Rhodococcus kronopolitis]|uniref:CBS domain-containing protein n=1 Tax=Rhodococcus kronopolitis TaxID=1460226 RepID=A0ABV9FUG2_9NOCA